MVENSTSSNLSINTGEIQLKKEWNASLWEDIVKGSCPREVEHNEDLQDCLNPLYVHLSSTQLELNIDLKIEPFHDESRPHLIILSIACIQLSKVIKIVTGHYML